MGQDGIMAAPLLDTQLRHLYLGLEHLDRQLTAIEAILTAGSSRTLFPQHISDLTPAERERLERGIARIRGAIERLLSTYGLRPETAAIPVRKAVRAHLAVAEVGADDLSAANLRGYGPMDSEQAYALEAATHELRATIAELLAELEGGQSKAGTAEIDMAQVRAQWQALAVTGAEGGSRLIAAAAQAMAEALEARPNLAGEELRLVAGDAMTAALEARAQQARALLATPPATAPPRPRVEPGLWKLSKPRFGLGAAAAKFAAQLEAYRAEIEESWQSYQFQLDRWLEKAGRP